MQNIIEPRHVLELQAKLGGQVRWPKFTLADIQPIIESPVLSGAHFEEFLRNGGRVSLNEIPLRIVEEQTITMSSGAWTQQVSVVKQVVERGDFLEQSSHGGMVRGSTLLAPEHWRQRRQVQMVILEVVPEYAEEMYKHAVVERKRVLQLLQLMDMYSSTLPEAIFFLMHQTSALKKPVVILNASRNDTYKNVSDAEFSWTDAGKYKFGPIGGDVDDPGVCGDHNFYLATRY